MVDVEQWLEQWVEDHLDASGHATKKADMHDRAKACVEDAKAAGISVADIKQASDGDLEVYLVSRQNILTSRHEGPTTNLGSPMSAPDLSQDQEGPGSSMHEAGPRIGSNRIR